MYQGAGGRATLHRALCSAALLLVCGCGGPAPTSAGRGAAESPPPSLAEQLAGATGGVLQLRGLSVDDDALAQVAAHGAWIELDFSQADMSAVTAAGLQKLAALDSLEVLVLGKMPLTDEGLAALAALNQLRRLNVTGTRLTDEGLATLLAFPKLNQLRLGAPRVTSQGLSRLQALSLQWLILVEMKIDDAGAAALAECKLHTLYLVRCELSAGGRAKIEAALPHVHEAE